MTRGGAFAGVLYAFAVGMLGTTLPTPMYPLYEQQLGFSVVMLTVVYAVYAVGVLIALLAFGRWSDTLGRRPLLLAALGLSVTSDLVFLTAGPVPQLLAGRVLSGLSAGILTGTATAAAIELAPPSWRRRAPALATAANIGGLGLGPLLAGLLVEYAPWPLHLSFVVHVALALIGVGLVIAAPETVDVVPGARPRRQRLSVPAEVRASFVRACISGFAGFAVLGLFTAVSGRFLSQTMGIDNHAVGGLVVFAVFAASAAAQVGLRGVPDRLGETVGCVALVLGPVAVAVALAAASLPLLVLGGVAAGVGQGLTFSRGMTNIAAAVPPDRRAEVTSTFFVVLYIAISVPVVGEGVAAEVWGLDPAGIGFALGVATLAAVALILLSRAHRRPHRRSAAGTGARP